jgi:hypothetical protein
MMIIIITMMMIMVDNNNNCQICVRYVIPTVNPVNFRISISG